VRVLAGFHEGLELTLSLATLSPMLWTGPFAAFTRWGEISTCCHGSRCSGSRRATASVEEEAGLFVLSSHQHPNYVANLASNHRAGNYSHKAGFRPMPRCVAEFMAKATSETMPAAKCVRRSRRTVSLSLAKATSNLLRRASGLSLAQTRAVRKWAQSGFMCPLSHSLLQNGRVIL
jgi:hypothetical protein